jgi:glycosyltransferase involved in cell wall biosynthesis
MTPPLRVLILIEHLKIGGAERAVWNMVQTMPREKVEYYVCLYRDIGLIGEDLQKKKYNIRLIKKDFLSEKFPFSFVLLRPFVQLIEAIVFCFRLSFFVRRNRITIIHSFLFSGNLWGRLASLLTPSVKVITTERSVAGWHRPLKHLWVNRLLKGLSDCISAVSKNVAVTIAAQQNLDVQDIVVIPNGIQLDLVNDRGFSAPLEGVKASAFKFGIIGRLERVKRHDLFIDALHDCIKKGLNVFGIIIGGGSERKNLMDKAHHLEMTDKVLFLGEVEDARNYVKHMDMLVNCSDAEGMSNAILEAMAEKCPVIATRAGGNEELVEDGYTGFLIDKNNADSLARAMETAVRNPERVKEMGKNSRLKVQNEYSLDHVMERWYTLYRTILEKRM